MQPFIKWAGGKRWLASDPSFNFPTFSGRYIEPFLGGGAVFFHLKPKLSIISDVNPRLIEAYRAIRDNWSAVYSELRRMQRLHSKDYYYEERSRRRRTSHTRAAQFIYLNRTCFNGLYRENLRGEFNVPIGTKDSVIFEGEDFSKISDALKLADIRVSDFSDTLSEAREGDFVFADPPYTTAHNLNGFVKYNQKIFSWDDQIRLRDAIYSAVDRGAVVYLTNADHESIHELYKGGGEYRSIGRASVMAGSSHFRTKTTEAFYVFR
ncbi:Dam family site-specific DNA-(adenine-N6)-methyltransferase [Xinfangfangia sp. D13-10-4-6]|uniref:DNA adenine methylase n=1 Tax=Pseudogemmobacter hezensis TaxID=2737662 RepID=UPI0015542729|nr:Dam family site-specific DNA-(adenine-N6)-methyltransferase [Pseudogemmobacter hezensis]NPD16131.1 Dam family site-specific DNA-(adenine-N6)-methyltransferase [Pseudogemmobacter hezensis]